MGELAPATASDGPANGYKALNAKLKALQAAADALQERAELIDAHAKRDARTAYHLAELCAAAQVTPQHTGRIQEISTAFAAVANTGTITSAADVLAQAAAQTRAAHRARHGGIHEAAHVGPPQALPGFYRQR